MQSQRSRRVTAIGLTIALLAATPTAAEPWPAEPLAEATNLTAAEGPGTNDFHVDLSGAVWNPVTRRLWVCRNGPGSASSKFWAMAEDGLGGFQIDSRNGNRGEWTGFGDLEDLTFADYNEDVVYLIVETEERIKEYDVSVYGTAVLRNNWDTADFLPLNGGLGAEGITFVPDAFLTTAGFRDAGGNLYTSQHGMDGLMFVAHQNGGRIYVFDLNRTDSTFAFVGAYRTGANESAGLAFDRSDGLLYVLHGGAHNSVEVLSLASSVVGSERRFNSITTYTSPGGTSENMEGIAIVPNEDCVGGERSFFLTIDGGGADSLFQFKQFPCTWECAADDDCSDGLFCNGEETCVSGSCAAGTDPCPGQLCDEAGDACVECLGAADCGDGNVCNGIENCVAGRCVSGTPLNCNDGNPCTDDACHSIIGCWYFADDTNSCDDGLFCNGPESCSGGGCTTRAAPCGGQTCRESDDTCGDCQTAADCDDGDPCTVDACASGSCTNVADLTDTDGDGTTDCADLCPSDPDKVAPGLCGCGVAEASCTPGGGGGDGGAPIAPPALPAPECAQDSDCSDGVFCNGEERCQAGSCFAAEAPCQPERCDESSARCMDCLTAGECDDGDPCTADACLDGLCNRTPSTTDSDGDATPDCLDECPHDPAKEAPGECGCGVPESECGGVPAETPEDSGDENVVGPIGVAGPPADDSADPDDSLPSTVVDEVDPVDNGTPDGPQPGPRRSAACGAGGGLAMLGCVSCLMRGRAGRRPGRSPR